MHPLAILLVICLGLVVGILAIIFVLVPLLKGIGWMIGAIFKAVGWLIMHIFEFIGGMISDVLRFLGAIIATVFLLPFVPANIVIGRWSAAAHFAESIKRECKVGFLCLYRVVLRRPLKLFMLHGLLEGLEQRVPEALAAAPGSDRPSKRIGQFDGYKIIGSLPVGGSGAKLYIAEPDEEKRQRIAKMPDQVVIKAFALAEGSSLPQIVRESRALEAAKQLGLVLEHGMDSARFFYVMPYHDGENLAVVTRQLHGETAGRGLELPQLGKAIGYVGDLLQTLAAYHREGLWHKDVKPENMIIHDGQAHLVDLGLVTPLQSAMTLTTHGTEYFRDPEMVRQALRGVKVHQVDGAKFDIYAAGAVLYFVVENTFPAHGGLSRFSRKSPEALRWIIRRAMADYNQRYETAQEMLADLRVLQNAQNPFAVKPVALPSMGGAAPNLDEPSGAPQSEEAPGMAADVTGRPAASPASLKQEEWDDVMQAVEEVRSAFTSTPRAKVAEKSQGPQKRPKLRLTNWWTGAYRVEDPGSASGPASPADVEAFRDQARAARAAAHGMRQQAHAIRQQVLSGSMSPRTAARQQVKAARHRARELRRQVQESRRKRARGKYAGKHPGSHGGMQLIGAMALLLIVFLFVPIAPWNVFRNAGNTGVTTVEVHPSPATDPELSRGIPLFLCVDGPYVEDRDLRERVDEVTSKYVNDGYHVVFEDGAMGRELESRFRRWQEDPDGQADELLEDALKKYSFAGILSVSADKYGRLGSELIRSERPGAFERTFVHPPDDTPILPYLVVNDHPDKNNPAVIEKVKTIVQDRQNMGWTIKYSEPEAEAEIRGALPSGFIGDETTLPVVLRNVLLKNGLRGVLWIETTPGDGPSYERIFAKVIDLDDIPLPELPLLPDSPLAPEPEPEHVPE